MATGYKLIGDIAKAVIARRLTRMIPDYEEIREVADDPDLSDAQCALVAKSIETRTRRLAATLLKH